MVYVHFLQLPSRVKGFSTKNDDNTYTIILNSRLNYEQQLKSYKHELFHIINKDFDKSDVDDIEFYAHSKEGENG